MTSYINDLVCGHGGEPANAVIVTLAVAGATVAGVVLALAVIDEWQSTSYVDADGRKVGRVTHFIHTVRGNLKEIFNQ